MKCPQCNNKELTGKQKYCSGACKMKASRTKKAPIVEDTVDSPVEPTPALSELPTPAVASTEETYEQRLQRRIKETGSLSAITIKVGYPPETAPSIQVPSKYDTEDLDFAIATVKSRLPM